MQIDKPVKQVVQQSTIILPHFDYEVPILYVADGTAYVPVISLCEMLGLRADRHIQQWRGLALWANACKLPLRTKSGKTRIVWCLHRGAFPFLYGCFNWSLVSLERRIQLRQATEEWIGISSRAYQEMQAQYKAMRRFLFTFLTAYADTTLTLRHLAERLSTLLDFDSCMKLDELVTQGTSIIEQATKHARIMLQDQARTPIIDVIKADSEGTIIEIFSLPLFPVVPHEDKEKLIELLEKVVQWYWYFTRFLKEREDIELRYTNVLRALPLTLPHLQWFPSFLLLAKQLRSDGWKDWHILQAVFSGVVNWSTERLGTQQNQQRDQEEDRIVRRLLKHGESPDDPLIPPTYFTAEMMEMLLNAGTATFLKKKGAVFRPRAYNFKILRELAQKRYQYLELDVLHTPVF